MAVPDPNKKLYRFVLSRVLTLTLSALLLAGLLLSVVNDLYAFVKPDRPVSLTLTEPLPLEQLCHRLSEREILKNPSVFQWYATRKGKKTALEQFSGTVELNASMSYREILTAFLS